MNRLDPETGRQALRSLIRERSLLGPLSVLYRRVGRLFQVPLPSFHPFVVGGASANRQVLISDRSRLLWRNPDPVTDVLRRGVLVVDGDEHDSYRGLMESLLHPAALSQYSRMMVEQADRVSACWQDGQMVDMLV